MSLNKGALNKLPSNKVIEYPYPLDPATLNVTSTFFGPSTIFSVLVCLDAQSAVLKTF